MNECEQNQRLIRDLMEWSEARICVCFDNDGEPCIWDENVMRREIRDVRSCEES